MTVTHDPGWTASAANGCTGTVEFGLMCRSQDTVVMDGHHGRRCAVHAPPEAAELIAQWQRDEVHARVDREPRHAWLRTYLPRLVGSPVRTAA